MAIVLRLDIDRPYGRNPFIRHVLSRFASDWDMGRIPGIPYLADLVRMLRVLNQKQARAFIFFRRCTYPSPEVLSLIAEGGHRIGLHLEDSRSYESFDAELRSLREYVGQPVLALSKHGSGTEKYGRHHYAPYEPERYIDWATRAQMTLFLGNLEDPAMPARQTGSGLRVFDAAFWLEPFWRDTRRFTVDWLQARAETQDLVMLVHPENVYADPSLTDDFNRILSSCKTTLLST